MISSSTTWPWPMVRETGTVSMSGGKVGDRLEVLVLTTRQAPVEHARRRVADVPEAVHHVARDEDDGAGADRGGPVTDGQLIGALDDEEHFFLVEMNVIRRAFTGFVPPHDDRDGAASGLGGEEYFHVEPEGLDRLRLFGRDDRSVQRCASCFHAVSSVSASEC